MKNKNKKISIIFIAFVFVALSFAPNSYASSVSLAPNTTLIIGASTTITISGSDATGRFNISSSNSGVVSLSSGSVWIENNSATITATAKSAGSATITLTPNDVSNGAGGDITSTIGTKAITINVNAPVVTAPTTPKTTTTTPTTTTGSNANLKKLVPNYEGLAPNFNPAVTKYSLTVPASATNLGLTIGVEATGAKYWISGEENLKMGDNTVSVTVTATDGTKKVYTIIVTKAADVAKANAYLSSIVIDGKTLSPEFTAENLAYDIGTVTSDVEKLTVIAFAQSEDSKIEITGNDKLVEGENIIKIKVTAVDGTTTKEYTIKVTKEVAVIAATTENVDIYGQTDNLQGNTPSKFKEFLNTVGIYLRTFWLVLTLFAFILFEFAQILYLYLKVEAMKKANKNDVGETNETNETIFSRRKKTELKPTDTNTSWLTDNNKEEAIDDISDELVDSSNVSKIGEDNTDNFEDTVDSEDDNK